MYITLRNKIISLVHVIEGTGVIVDRGAIGLRSEISTNPTNREEKKTKPLHRAQRKSLDVDEGNGKCQDLLVFDRQVNVHHVGRGSGSQSLSRAATDKLERDWKGQHCNS